PDQFVTGIYELLINAVEHGNLGIGSDAKAELLRLGKWKEEMMRRLTLPENADKEVEIRVTYDEYECRLTISDQGKGFPWKKYIGRPVGIKQLNGRGLWIVFSSKFDRIIYNPAGNEVTCVVKWCQWPSAQNKRLETA